MYRLKNFIVYKSKNNTLEVNHMGVRLSRKDQLFLVYQEYEHLDPKFTTFDIPDFSWLHKREIEKLNLMYKNADYDLPEARVIYEANKWF